MKKYPQCVPVHHFLFCLFGIHVFICQYVSKCVLCNQMTYFWISSKRSFDWVFFNFNKIGRVRFNTSERYQIQCPINVLKIS